MDLAVPEAELEGEHLVVLAQVAVLVEVGALLGLEAELRQHGIVGAALEVEDGEVVEVALRQAGQLQ